MTGTDSLGNSYSVTPVFDENSGAQLVNGSVVARNDEGQSLVTSVTRGGLRNIFINASFKSAVKTIWHDAFNIIIDTLRLGSCQKLLWEFIHH